MKMGIVSATAAYPQVLRLTLYCDVCGKPITDPLMANLVWETDEPGTEVGCVHKTCDYGRDGRQQRTRYWNDLHNCPALLQLAGFPPHKDEYRG